MIWITVLVIALSISLRGYSFCHESLVVLPVRLVMYSAAACSELVLPRTLQ